MLIADDEIWDQYGFNKLVYTKSGPSVDEDSGLVYAYDGNLKLGILPATIFCSGHTYFVQLGGTVGIRHRLREAMVFYDPPEYFDTPGGYLSFKPSISKSLLLEGEHNIGTHFALINYQIKQIRTAFAIASLLNRTLVEANDVETVARMTKPKLLPNKALSDLRELLSIVSST